MTDKKSNDSRRKLLKSIAAGSGAVVAGKSLPESWSKPVINSIVLPAHATTTDDAEDLPSDATTTPDPRCSIPAGCKGISEGRYVTFAQDLYEGDFFDEGKTQYFDSGCQETNQTTFGPLVVARTEADAFDIFTENGVSNSYPHADIDQGGECQIWYDRS